MLALINNFNLRFRIVQSFPNFALNQAVFRTLSIFAAQHLVHNFGFQFEIIVKYFSFCLNITANIKKKEVIGETL